jgi:hypothetical protein
MAKPFWLISGDSVLENSFLAIAISVTGSSSEPEFLSARFISLSSVEKVLFQGHAIGWDSRYRISLASKCSANYDKHCGSPKKMDSKIRSPAKKFRRCQIAFASRLRFVICPAIANGSQQFGDRILASHRVHGGLRLPNCHKENFFDGGYARSEKDDDNLP